MACASTAGLAGVFYSSKLSSVTPDQFKFDVSFTALAMVVLGGMGNIWGVAAGALIVYELQSQGLKQLDAFMHALNLPVFALGPIVVNLSAISYMNFQNLLYGLALALMMILRSEGLFPSRQRRRELHEEPAIDEMTSPDPAGERE